MADRPVRIITKQTAVPGRIPTGTTGYEDNLIRQGEMAQNTADKKLFGYDGVSIFEYGSNSFLGLTGGTISGNLKVTGNLSGGTLISGSTNLYNIFQGIGSPSTQVQNGTNTYTGGTTQFPTVNISALTINSITVSGSALFNTLSATTFYSGGTNLINIINTAVTAVTSNLTSVSVQNGLNTYTGGTSLLPTINISAATLTYLSATTISGGTILSGNTNLYSIFARPELTVNNVNAGSNITTGGTAISPIINLTASPSVNNLTVSGTGNFTGTIQSGGTDLNNIYVQGSGTNGTVPLWNGTKLLGNSVITQAGTGVTVNGSVYVYGNIDILGTASTFNTQTIQTADNNIAMNLSGSHVSAFGGGITVLSGIPNNISSTWTIDSNGAWSANTQIISSAITINNGNINVLGGGQLQSGSTDLYSIFATNASIISTYVQPGTNISTGGTASLPIINLVASPSVNNIMFSGTAIGNALSATTISGGTIYSGSTELSVVMQNLINSKAWLLSGNTNGVEKYIGTNDNFALPFNINGVEAMRITNEGSAANRIFINSSTSIGASNAGIQYSNAAVANRAQIKLHSYFTGTSIAGVSTLTSRSGTIGVNNAVVNGQEYSKWTAQAGATTIGSAPIAGTWAFIANNVNSLTVTSDWRVQLTNSAGTLGDRFYLTSEGVINAYNDILPNVTDVYDLGNSTKRFNNAYLNGGLTANTISSTTINGGNILSAGTDLYSIFITTNDGNDITRVQPGTNIYTGGTGNLPTINISAATLSNLTVSGNTNLQEVTATTLSSTTITASTVFIKGTSDSTELNIFANSTQTKPLISLLNFGGTELLRVNSNTLENTFLGYSAGTSISSGLYNTFLGSSAGSGNTTGGVNVFVGHGVGSVISGSVSNTFVGAGAGKIKRFGDYNVYIGANAGGNTDFGDNNVYIGDWSGRFNYSGANNTYIGQATGYLSSGSGNVFIGQGAGTSVSGSNLLYIANSGTLTPLIFGNFNTSEVKINGSLTANTFSASTIKGGVFLSAGTDLYSIFLTTADGNDITRVQPGSNITTGGTGNNPIVNLTASPSVNNITFSGTAIGGTVQADAGTFTSLSATTLSGGTILSGSTNLYSIFATIPDQNDITRVQPGSNITTGGTGNNPIINLVASPSLNGLTLSGTGIANAFSATSISATSYYNDAQQIFGTFRGALSPLNTGNTWVRSTDSELFIYDTNRIKWLSPNENFFGASRNSAASTDLFLRYYDGVPMNTTPLRIPYDITITKIIANGNANQTWKAFVLTGTTVATDVVLTLNLTTQNYSAKTDYNLNVSSGSSLYLYCSGTSIDFPTIMVYYKQKG